MSRNLQHDLSVSAPLEQAERCVNMWLAEENLTLDKRIGSRLTALVARYFHLDANVDDALILSFLRHYSGWKEIDLEDMSAVSYEIHNLLEQAHPMGHDRGMGYGRSKPSTQVIGWGMVCVLLCLGLAHAYVQGGYTQVPPISPQIKKQNNLISQNEGDDLRHLVRQVSDHTGQSYQKIWAEVKSPFKLRRYRDMSRNQYQQARHNLIQRLNQPRLNQRG